MSSCDRTERLLPAGSRRQSTEKAQTHFQDRKAPCAVTFRFLASLAAFLVTPAVAHHSPSAFDMNRVVAFEGTISGYEWRNPHVYLEIEDSEQAIWLIETDATPVLTRSGWSRESFVPGDLVLVRARPDLNSERKHGLLLSITGPDGVTLARASRAQRGGGSRPIASATDFSGVWQGELLPTTNLVRVPLVSAISNHPLTERGAAARASFDRSMMPVAACISTPTPVLLGLTTIYVGEFELRDGAIVFRSELYDAERVIHTDGRDHPTNGARTNQGHSIGRWEGDTLVVDTALFADNRSPYTVGIPSGSQKHVVERYRLSEDGTQMLIDVFLEDPEYLAEPFTATLTWNYSPHLERLSIACDPEVARRFLE